MSTLQNDELADELRELEAGDPFYIDGNGYYQREWEDSGEGGEGSYKRIYLSDKLQEAAAMFKWPAKVQGFTN